MKIVLNRSVGAFRLSEAAIEIIGAAKAKIIRMNDWSMPGRSGDKLSALITRPLNLLGMWLSRTDKDLVEAVERLGQEAGANGAELEVVDIPDGVEWAIGDVCGIEYVRAAGELWPKGWMPHDVFAPNR
jgi:hypothetical protein